MVGTLATWALTTVAAHFILGLNVQMAVLLGAILVVTGPTVIIPLLRDIRPSGRVSSILRWEGILIDPVGVTLALLVFEGIFVADLQVATTQALLGFLQTMLIGIVFGTIAALIMTVMLRRYWIPDYLQNAVTVMVLVGAFALSDTFQPESGLLTATVMGIVMANQRAVPVKHIIEFKENLGVMLISNLFILLAARLSMDDLRLIGVNSLIFVAVLMFVVRPAGVFLSTLRSDLNWRERLFIAWMAPRGIVAAAAASVFALELMSVDHPQAELLTPITFVVIMATVAVYGLTAGPLARRLGVAQSAPQGVLFVGAHRAARQLAQAVVDQGFRVLLVDSNWENIQAARIEGLPTHYGNILSEDIDELNLTGIGRMFALTSNDEVNSLAATYFREVFERAELYQIPTQSKRQSDAVPQHLRGRLLFSRDMCYKRLESYFNNGAELKATPLTPEFTYEDFKTYYNDEILPLFMVDENEQLTVFAIDQALQPRAGVTIISLVNTGQPLPVPESPVATALRNARR
jgi:NhaP-type Na+/H+ or K+/H+ antiporter